MAIMRGSTPTHIFQVDTDLTHVEVMYVTYKQGCVVLVEKEIEDIRIRPDTLELTLTQQETLRFQNRKDQPIEIQIRARFPNGETLVSNVMKVQAEKVLKEGVI